MTPGEVASALTYGVVPAAPVPCRSDGTLDAEAHSGMARALAAAPIAGLAVWTHIGRGLHLEPELSVRVAESCRAALPAGRPLVAAIGARPRVQTTRGKRQRLTPPANPLALTGFVVSGTLEMAREATSAGADALLVFPPILLKDLDDRDNRIVEVHAALKEAGRPVLAWYLDEDEGGIRYSERVLDRVLALPHVAGIVVTTTDSVVAFQEVARRVPPDKLLISGDDRFLGYSLMLGARAITGAVAAARPGLVHSLLRSYRDGDWSSFVSASARCDALAAELVREPLGGVPRRVLHLMAHDGTIPADSAYDPWGPSVPAWQLEELVNAAARLA